MTFLVCSYEALRASTDSSSNLGIWLPAVVSIITLIVNIIFTVFIGPKIAEKQNQRVAMYKICTDFFDFLTDLVSMDNFDGAPSTVRKYSLKIHFMFKTGVAPRRIEAGLEAVYQKVKERKNLHDDAVISKWEKSYRELVHELRVDLANYVGVFNP